MVVEVFSLSLKERWSFIVKFHKKCIISAFIENFPMTPSFVSSSDTQLSKLIENHLILQREYQRLEDRFTLLESKLENLASPSSTHATKHYMKLEIPRFTGMTL